MSENQIPEGTVAIVEAAISMLGIPAEKARTATANQWLLKKGSADILLMLRTTKSFSGEKGLLVILSPFMKMPTDYNLKNELMHELLELNHNSTITTFSIGKDNVVYLTANRFIQGMMKEEIIEMLHELGAYADYFDEKFKKKYPDLSGPNART